LRSGTAPCGAPWRLFSDPGPRFPAHSRADQPAPGRRSVVTSEWSPEPPECGMPPARGDRVTWRSLSRPLCPEVSAAHLRRVLPARPTQAMPRESAPRGTGCAHYPPGFSSGDNFFSEKLSPPPMGSASDTASRPRLHRARICRRRRAIGRGSAPGSPSAWRDVFRARRLAASPGLSAPGARSRAA